jgi:hypothetical protein
LTLTSTSPRALRVCRARGFTVAELVVALTVGGAALAGFALAVGQQERLHGELSRRVRAHAQQREGIVALIGDLWAAAPAAGDFAPGLARDSSIELRTAIGAAIVCDLAGHSVTGALASFVTPPQAGDTAWAYMPTDTAATWRPLAVMSATALLADRTPTCAFPASAATLIEPGRTRQSRYSLELSDAPPGLSSGTPLRITRTVRYSLYRSADSQWYLGRREWSRARARFETVQPVSGPFRRYAPEGGDASGLELRYAKRDGASLPSASPATDSIATVTVVLRASPADGHLLDRRDVMSVTLALRNLP